MVKYNVFKIINQNDLLPGTKLFDSTWAMKKKSPMGPTEPGMIFEALCNKMGNILTAIINPPWW